MKFFIFLCLLILCFAPNKNANSAEIEAFALMDMEDKKSTFDTYLSRAFIDGIALRLSWADMEPENDEYEWKILDSALEVAKRRGKKVTLHIAGSPFDFTPRWVLGKGTRVYRLRTALSDFLPPEPVPWDKNYLKKWTEFIIALSEHIKEQDYMGTLAYISPAAPYTEMSLMGCKNERLSGNPYKRESYLDAWNTTIQTLNQNFPTQTIMLTAPRANICKPDNDGKTFYNLVLNSPNNKNLMVFAEDLNALGSKRMDTLGSTITGQNVGAQFIWSYTHDNKNRFKGKLQDAVCKGILNYGARYFEFYKHDIDNPNKSVRSVITNPDNVQACQN